MKNQYFGDVRDLFKYDLIQRILKELSSSQRFTFIPMLTKNENDSKRGEGNKRDFDNAKKNGKPGTNNGKLTEFLSKYKETDRDERDFTAIKNYFEAQGIWADIYNEYFDDMKRGEYFKNIPGAYLHNPLIFVDPDIGLQIKKSTEKHLLYWDVKYLYDRMDESSTLMIYQHFPRARRKHKEYSPEGRSNKLKEETGNLPICISDNEIIFFLLTKNDGPEKQLKEIISRYKGDYKKLIIGNVNYNGT